MVEEDLDSKITSCLRKLAGIEKVEMPGWDYDKQTQHIYYRNPENIIRVECFYRFLWENLYSERQKRDTLWSLVEFELAHNFKHYLDDVLFDAGSAERGKGEIIPPHKSMPQYRYPLSKEITGYDTEAFKYAIKKTGVSYEKWERLCRQVREYGNKLDSSLLESYSMCHYDCTRKD